MLQVRNLTIYYRGGDGREVRALDNVSFELSAGETLGVLGVSGCGKTTLALSLLGLLPEAARVSSGSICFRERDLTRADERTLRSIRGAEASIIFQEPSMSLNPVMRVGDQVMEVVRAHRAGNGRSHRREAQLALAEVRLKEPEIYSSYPHQLSSGQRQRVTMAQALVCKPSFLIADEPTSALDNVTQAEILGVLKELKQRLQLALLFITHNPALLVGTADRVLVLRDGQVVEQGLVARVFEKPALPYTESLLRSVSPLSRCSAAERELTLAPVSTRAPRVLLEARGLTKRYVPGGRYSRSTVAVKALDDVSLILHSDSVLALVGESGAGKSTLGRCLARLEEPNSGEIWFDGSNLLDSPRQELFRARPSIQFIFQDPAAAMNPGFTALDVVEEPLRIQFNMPKKLRREVAVDMIERVGLSAEWVKRSAGEFSGGQRQRLAIARCLVLKPRVLILDEALSSLDLPMQAQILKLLEDLKTSHRLTYLFITHDLRLAASIADEIAVMRQGRIIEFGTVGAVLQSPAQPYTRVLLAAIPGTRTMPMPVSDCQP